MDYTFTVPRAPVPAVPASPCAPLAACPGHAPNDPPFMSNMEEIAYWVTTKRAPCLFNYDNVIKRKREEAHCSNISKPKSVQSLILETSPKKKKKRKLSLLDDESVSTEKHQNVYFETSQNKNQQTILDSCKSDTLGSDLDFNIKSPSIRNKSKKLKLNKTNKRTLHKKNKIVTSTPKVENLRRSLRKSQRNSNNNSHLNDSFEVFNCEIFNSNNTKYSNIVSGKKRTPSKCKKAPELAGGDQGTHKQNCNETPDKQPVKLNNGQFDDMSDVSGFTANYIRSTKIHSSKKINTVRRKGGRNFIKESQYSKKDDNAMIVCLNKSVNTGLSKTPLMNCSTDSSQNVLNLVTLKSNNDKSTRISRSTSLLKFMDTRNGNKKPCTDLEQKGQPSECPNILNVSFNSKSSITSRYPIRHKNNSLVDSSPIKFEKNCQQALDKRLKNNNELHISDRKENPVDKSISRTRSGKCIGLALRQPENSVLVLNSSMEPVSSIATINVATPPNTLTRSRSKRRSGTSRKPVVSAKTQDKSGQRESLRDKSGFAECFSDTDDNDALKQNKFFC